MTELLYLQDCYQKTATAKITAIKDENCLVLDQTIFYPTGGGQPHDTGKICKGEDCVEVINVVKKDGEIHHELASEHQFSVGDEVELHIDWDRRYKLMRYHTAAHIICKLLEDDADTLISGNQLSEEKGRIDFTLEDFDREYLQSFEGKANDIISQEKDIKKYFLTREEAQKDSSLFKLLKGFPEHIKDVRVVSINDFDKQACGGTHLDNTKEIKGVKFVKFENKGSKRRRIVFQLVE